MAKQGHVLHSRSTGVLEKVIGLLSDLRATPSGRVIYGHIEQMLEAMASEHRKTEEAYASFIGMLLEACMAQIPAEDPLHTHLRLVQMRLTPPLSVSELGALNRFVEGIADEMLNTLPLRHHDLAPALTPVLASFGVPADVAAPPAPVVETPSVAQAEQRVNAAYRAHLDEKREAMQRLQTDFVEQMGEAEAEHRDFGSLLENALQVLRGAGIGAALEAHRLEIIQALEEICERHRALAGRFGRVQEYLSLIEDDNQQLSEELDRVRLLSLTDELTGLPNRRAFMRRLEDEVSRVQRHGAPLSLVILDLDHFKQINDLRGHAAGDAVLRHYAGSVLSIFRHHDLVARYGGEEFAVLLPNTHLAGVVRALEKVRRRLDEITGQLPAEEALPTFSAGVAEYRSGETANSLIERADTALYEAKRSGRDRVEVHTGEQVVPAAPDQGQV